MNFLFKFQFHSVGNVVSAYLMFWKMCRYLYSSFFSLSLFAFNLSCLSVPVGNVYDSIVSQTF